MDQELAVFKSFYLRLFNQDHNVHACYLMHSCYDGSDDDFPIVSLQALMEDQDDNRTFYGQYYSPEWVKKIFHAIEACYHNGRMEEVFHHFPIESQPQIEANLQDIINLMQHATNDHSSLVLIEMSY